MNIGDIRLPEESVGAKKIQSVAMSAADPVLRDAALLNGLFILVADLEARIYALENPPQ